jgi:hypothetical protein
MGKLILRNMKPLLKMIILLKRQRKNIDESTSDKEAEVKEESRSIRRYFR